MQRPAHNALAVTRVAAKESAGADAATASAAQDTANAVENADVIASVSTTATTTASTDELLSDDEVADIKVPDFSTVNKGFYQINPDNVNPIAAIKEPDAYDYEADVLLVGYGVGGTSAITGLTNHNLSVVAMERSDRDHWVEHAGVHWLYFFGAPEWMEAEGYGDQTYDDDFIREHILAEATDSTDAISQEDMKTLIRFYEANLESYNMIVNSDPSDPSESATRFEQVSMFPALDRWPTLIPVNANIGGWANPPVKDGKTFYPGGNKYHPVENYLDRNAESKGAKVLWGTMVTNLIVNDAGEVCGAKGVDAQGNVVYVKARAVMDCVGGFGANYDMVRYLIPNAPETIGCHIGPLTNDGRGIRMCQGAGAAIRSCGRVDDPADAGIDTIGMGKDWNFARNGAFTAWMSGYFHIAHRLGRNPWLKVNKYGYRFMNEDNGWTEKVKYTAHQPDHTMIAVFDSHWHEHMHKLYDIDCRWGGCERVSDLSGSIYWTDDKIIEGPHSAQDVDDSFDQAVQEGYIIKADSLEELADLAGINKANLLETVEHYNEMCDAGEDTDYGKDPNLLWPVVDPPFYACVRKASYAWGCGSVLATNVKGEVLNDKGEPIPGLYCGSNDASILDYATGECYRDGLIIGGAVYAITMGYLSSESIAEKIEADGGSMGPVVENAPTGKTIALAATDAGQEGYDFVSQNCTGCHSVPSKANFAELKNEDDIAREFTSHDGVALSQEQDALIDAWVHE